MAVHGVDPYVSDVLQLSATLIWSSGYKRMGARGTTRREQKLQRMVIRRYSSAGSGRMAVDGMSAHVGKLRRMANLRLLNGQGRTAARGMIPRMRLLQSMAIWIFFNGPDKTVVHGMKGLVQ